MGVGIRLRRERALYAQFAHAPSPLRDLDITVYYSANTYLLNSAMLELSTVRSYVAWQRLIRGSKQLSLQCSAIDEYHTVDITARL